MTCNTCGEVKPVELFTRRRGKPAPWCKACAAAKSRRWRQAHPNYDDAHRKVRGYARVLRHRAMRPDCQATCCRYMGSDYQNRRRARKSGALVEKVYKTVVWRKHDGVCGICDKPCDPANWHLDHIVPLARGGEHSYANTQPAHPSCNLRKGYRLPEELAA